MIYQKRKASNTSMNRRRIMTDEEKELEEVAEDIINGMNEDLDDILDPVEDYSDFTEPI